MIIPEKLRIGAVDYKVNYVDRPILVKNRGCKGCIDYDNNIIELLDDGEKGKHSLNLTLLHEIIHGILFERIINLNEISEEDFCDHFAASLYQIIRDNPDLFKEEEYGN